MSEWPKTHYVCPECGRGWVPGTTHVCPDGKRPVIKAIPVIPADLGRELYEVLRREVNGWTGPDSPPAQIVLCRYEREVGK